MTVTATPSSPGRSAHLAVVALTLSVFAVVVTFVTWRLRDGLREQILLGRAETLAAVASLQLANGADTLNELKLSPTEVPGELLASVLKASKFRDVLAIRVFDSDRRFSDSVPLGMSDEPPGREDWSERPYARLQPRANLQALTGIADDGRTDRVPPVLLLEAWVPLRRSEGAALAGFAQFWIDGRELVGEFATLDRRLLLQAPLAWLAGAVVIVLSFRRLAVANRALEQRSEDLRKANLELVLAAKTSALGAVTAHLIHEIKNPLAGLEIFMAGQADSTTRAEDGREIIAATELTKRLRTMINDVVGVLRDEQHGAHFKLTGSEIVELAIERVRPSANALGVRVVAEFAVGKPIPGRRANLAGLVLRNLLQNAIEASPPAGIVRVSGGDLADEGMEFLIEDQGSGLADSVRTRLFQPCASTKSGGSGLGLALSQQLAQQASGRIELVRSDNAGTCFRLTLGPGG